MDLDTAHRVIADLHDPVPRPTVAVNTYADPNARHARLIRTMVHYATGTTDLPDGTVGWVHTACGRTLNRLTSTAVQYTPRAQRDATCKTCLRTR